MYRRARRPPGSEAWGSCRQWLDWLAEDGRLMPIVGTSHSLCSTCHGPVGVDEWGDPYSDCYQCGFIPVRGYVTGLVPISYSTAWGLEPLIAQLKDDGDRWLSAPLGCLLHLFLVSHLPCIERTFGMIDVCTVVPSHPSSRGGFDHMKNLFRAVTPGATARPWDLDLLHRTTETRDRRSLDVHAYAVAPGRDVRDATVLLVDDTFTSGATLASAAFALGDQRAKVVGVTLGRQLNRNFDLAVPIIEEQSDRKWSLDQCVLCQ